MSEPPGSGSDSRSGDPPGRAEPPSLSRLDPDRAAARPASESPVSLESPETTESRETTESPETTEGPASDPAHGQVVDTRRYRWMIGIIGLVVVVAVSIYQFASHGVGTTGVPAGGQLHYFAAPLADTDLNGNPNVNPPCTLARHDPRAMNICLLARRAPLVLSFFVTGASQCERQVSALQTLSREFPASEVQFAAIAIHASHKSVASLVRSRGWTIPVSYDLDGAVGELYGIAVCPMTELAYRGGIVKERLIGDRWQTSTALAPQVRALVAAQRTRPSS